jgi:mannan polymerase II complex ANP1 subunit
VERLAREKEEQQRAEQKDNTQSKSLVDDQNVDGEAFSASSTLSAWAFKCP